MDIVKISFGLKNLSTVVSNRRLGMQIRGTVVETIDHPQRGKLVKEIEGGLFYRDIKTGKVCYKPPANYIRNTSRVYDLFRVNDAEAELYVDLLKPHEFYERVGEGAIGPEVKKSRKALQDLEFPGFEPSVPSKEI